MSKRYTDVGGGFDIAAIPPVVPNKGGRPRDERLGAIDARAAEWLAEDFGRTTRDAAKKFAPEYVANWHQLHPIEQNDRVNDVRKRMDTYLAMLERSIR